MNFHTFLCFVLLIIHIAVGEDDEDKIVAIVNSRQTSWKAEKLSDDLKQQLESMEPWNLDYSPIEEKHKIRVLYHRTEDLPKHFDARDNWPMCKEVIGHIRNQGGCGSYWGVSIASFISDRTCIGSNGTIKFNASAEDLLTCCPDCKDEANHPCRGGITYKALRYWRDHGVVSGGELNSSSGCMPYSDELFHKKENKSCHHHCTNPDYGVRYEEDKYPRAVVVYKLPNLNVRQMKVEIFYNGPLISTFTLFKDFQYYKNGVYMHETGERIGAHAVKIIGWGEEDGKKYWMVANTWGPKWGMNGFCKILRGQNQANIEVYVLAGKITKLSSNEYLIDDIEDEKSDSKTNKSSWIECVVLLVVAFCTNKLHC